MSISLSMFFNDTISFICIWGGDIESINHLFLHCPEYSEARPALFDNIQSIDKMLLSQNESSLTRLLFYGDPKRNSSVYAFILNSAIEFIVSSGRFNGPLFNGAYNFSCGFLFVSVYLFHFVISHSYLYPRCL